jgi:quercetin dioxygenase-like cupin family protein
MIMLMKIKPTAAFLLIAFTVLAAIPFQPAVTLFENSQVKVVRAVQGAHVKAKFHDHKTNRVMTYLQAGTQRFEFQDGRKPEIINWKPGQVDWAPANEMHAWEVIGDNSFNIIEVLLNTPGQGKAIASKLDPLKLDPKHYKLELENAQVRVIRVHIEAHGTAPLHEHPVNRVTIYLTDQNFRTTDAQGKIALVKHKAGDAVWGTPITHAEENLSAEPFEAVSVELKN